MISYNYFLQSYSNYIKGISISILQVRKQTYRNKGLDQSDRARKWQNLDFKRICCYSTAFYSAIFLQFHNLLGIQNGSLLPFVNSINNMYFFSLQLQNDQPWTKPSGSCLWVHCRMGVFSVEPVGEWKRLIMCKQHCITEGES